jgi:hypothetical protein
MTMSISINKDGPCDPLYVLELAEGFAEIPRALNTLTRHHEALEEPHQPHTVIGYLETAAFRTPQLVDQLARWYEVEAARARLRVTAGDWEGVPMVAAATVRLRADRVRGIAEELTEALKLLGEATKDLAGPDEDGSDD